MHTGCASVSSYDALQLSSPTTQRFQALSSMCIYIYNMYITLLMLNMKNCNSSHMNKCMFGRDIVWKIINLFSKAC